MTNNIEAIFLDVGNTLRIVIPDPPFQAKARKDLMDLVGAKESEEAFFKGLDVRWKEYRNQSKASQEEASEKELWTKWLLPDYPAEKIGPLAGKLTRLWRDHDGRRVPRPDATPTIIELHKRGYILGIIANTITETEIPDWLEAEGITKYFKSVVLSSKVGFRKPDPQIYWEAARRAGVEPARCAYVGDNPVRDVEGTRAAGFGMMIVMFEPATLAKEPPTGEVKPDYTIHETHELLDIFPPRRTVKYYDLLEGPGGKKMSPNIESIFFDTGNTLRVVVKDAVFQNRALQGLAKLAGAKESPNVFYERLNKRYETYKKQAKATQLQVSETELWTRWMLPDNPADKIGPLAVQLTRLWHDCDGRRVPRPDAKQTIIELHKRGYILGIIANAISSTEIPDWLEADGISQYFKAVVLSSQFGRRKPDPYIYLEAASIAGVKPANCAYVGDNPNRDIQGARQAGFGMVFILLEQATLEKESPKDKIKPDGIIRECSDLLNFFPPSNRR